MATETENIKKLMETEEKLYRYAGEDRIVLSGDMIELLSKEDKKQTHFNTGMPTLDNATGGCAGGELWVVSGTTGEGKTRLCQTFTKNIEAQGIYSLFFSYEVMAGQFLRQFGSKLPVFCMPAKLKGNSLQWLNQRIYEARLKYGIQCVFVDHLHFLIDLSRNNHNMSLEIGSIVRGLKKIALFHNIVFFLVAHTTKVKTEIELGLDHIRDSSFISQEADTVLMLWRVKEENEAILKIGKNRKNGIINKKIRLKMIDGFLKELQ